MQVDLHLEPRLLQAMVVLDKTQCLPNHAVVAVVAVAITVVVAVAVHGELAAAAALLT